MSRYIDADALIKTVNEFIEFYNLGMLNVDSFVEAVVDMLPTADVREVVRCKDCKHARVHDYAPAECQYYCTLAVNYHSQNFFCALGERREE